MIAITLGGAYLLLIVFFIFEGRLRLRAPRVLGQYYTRTLRVAEQQTVVDVGPYHTIRHPGYAGLVSLWVGAGLASGNGIVAVVIAVAMFSAYAYRIRAEEAALVLNRLNQRVTHVGAQSEGEEREPGQHNGIQDHR